MAGRNSRKKVMLDMSKHVERNNVFKPIAQSSSDIMGPVAMMVNRPDREKGSQALPNSHRAHVISKSRVVPKAEN